MTDPDLVWRSWPDEDEVVVFSPRAGAVHLLTRSSRVLLRELSRTPLTTADIRRVIAIETNLASDLIEEALPELLRTLEEADLIERIEP